MTTRSEHVRWSKLRAREYLSKGDAKKAVGSMISDLAKHPETAEGLPSLQMSAFAAALSLERAHAFIDGIEEEIERLSNETRTPPLFLE